MCLLLARRSEAKMSLVVGTWLLVDFADVFADVRHLICSRTLRLALVFGVPAILFEPVIAVKGATRRP